MTLPKYCLPSDPHGNMPWAPSWRCSAGNLKLSNTSHLSSSNQCTKHCRTIVRLQKFNQLGTLCLGSIKPLHALHTAQHQTVWVFHLIVRMRGARRWASGRAGGQGNGRERGRGRREGRTERSSEWAGRRATCTCLPFFSVARVIQIFDFISCPKCLEEENLLEGTSIASKSRPDLMEVFPPAPAVAILMGISVQGVKEI